MPIFTDVEKEKMKVELCEEFIKTCIARGLDMEDAVEAAARLLIHGLNAYSQRTGAYEYEFQLEGVGAAAVALETAPPRLDS